MEEDQFEFDDSESDEEVNQQSDYEQLQDIAERIKVLREGRRRLFRDITKEYTESELLLEDLRYKIYMKEERDLRDHAEKEKSINAKSEKIKYWASIVVLTLSILNMVVDSRFVEEAILILGAWYYTILFLTEHFLLWSYTRIGFWRRFHHLLSALIIAVLLKWNQKPTWVEFNIYFTCFTAYVGTYQILSYWSQSVMISQFVKRRELRRMDIGLEGFHGWMWDRILFMAPLTFIGIGFQFYIYLKLHWLHTQYPKVWEITTLCNLFLILGLGNLAMTNYTLMNKVVDIVQFWFKRQVRAIHDRTHLMADYGEFQYQERRGNAEEDNGEPLFESDYNDDETFDDRVLAPGEWGEDDTEPLLEGSYADDDQTYDDRELAPGEWGEDDTEPLLEGSYADDDQTYDDSVLAPGEWGEDDTEPLLEGGYADDDRTYDDRVLAPGECGEDDTEPLLEGGYADDDQTYDDHVLAPGECGEDDTEPLLEGGYADDDQTYDDRVLAPGECGEDDTEPLLEGGYADDDQTYDDRVLAPGECGEDDTEPLLEGGYADNDGTDDDRVLAPGECGEDDTEPLLEGGYADDDGTDDDRVPPPEDYQRTT